MGFMSVHHSHESSSCQKLIVSSPWPPSKILRDQHALDNGFVRFHLFWVLRVWLWLDAYVHAAAGFGVEVCSMQFFTHHGGCSLKLSPQKD